MKLFGIFSDDRVYKSKSPVMHNRVMRQMGINGAYVPFRVEPEDIGSAVRAIRTLNLTGVNITVPYKEAVMVHLDELSEGARTIGAVNTIACHGRKLIGHNTDAAGFTSALFEAGFSAEGKEILVIGTGGAAKAVLFGLKGLNPARVVLAGRNLIRTRELAETFGAEPIGLDEILSDNASDLVVNATSVSGPDEAPGLAALTAEFNFSRAEFIFDLNYGRKINFWQTLAESHGARFRDGQAMLALQARESFRIWTGLEIDPNLYKAALREVE